MISIAQYVGALADQVMDARVALDLKSVELADRYSKDELLKHLVVPRIKIPEITVSAPIAVSKVTVDKTIQSDFSLEKFQKIIQKEFDKLVHQANSATIQNTILNFKDIKSVILITEKLVNNQHNLSHEGRIAYMNQLLDQNIDNIISEVINGNQLSTYFSKLVKKEIFKRNLLDKLKKGVKDSLKIKVGKLREIQINPETKHLTDIGNDKALLRIEVKMIEEGILMNTLVHEDGTKTKILETE